MPVTIKDVAEKSRVSVGTVSAVINNKGRISQATRQKVLEVVAKLGYDPAGNLPHRRWVHTGTIGLVIAGSITEIHPGYYRSIMAAKQATVDTDYRFQFFFEHEIRRMAVDLVHLGREQIGCDGLIIFCPQQDFNVYMRNLAAWEIPMVLIRRQTDLEKVMLVRNSERQSVWVVLEHLYGLGHRRIAWYTASFKEQEKKTFAYRTFLDSKDLPYDPDLVLERTELPFSEADLNRPFVPWDVTTEYYHPLPGLMDKMRPLLTGKDPVTAVGCRSDYLAVEMIKSIQAAGFAVPEDVSVTGMNNNPAATLFEPAITTSNMPVEEMVRAAADLLVNKPENGNGARTILEFDNTLVVRESTAAPK